MRRSDRGFLLIDSLLAVFIVLCMCALCMTMYQVILRYEDGYEAYQERTSNSLTLLFQRLPYCEACRNDESD